MSLHDALPIWNSPHLTAETTRDPAFTCDVLEDGPDAALAAVMETLGGVPAAPLANDAVMAMLRRTKRRGSLAIANGDLTGAWPLERVTGALTALAEATRPEEHKSELQSLRRT